jgi:hypothetical protein
MPLLNAKASACLQMPICICIVDEARAFINIYDFSLFRWRSVLSAWVSILHLQLKNVQRLEGARIDQSNVLLIAAFFVFFSLTPLLLLSKEVPGRNTRICVSI